MKDNTTGIGEAFGGHPQTRLMVTMDPLQVAEEEVVESSGTNKLEDIYRLVAQGTFPSSFCSIRRKNLKRYARKFTLEGDCLYYVGPKKEEMREVLVDPERRRHVFLESHLAESGHHLGQKKTVRRIQRGYYWLGIVKDVIEWIKLCETCQGAEHQKNLSRKWKPLKVEHPWQALGMELHGPFPQTSRENSYVLTVTDCFTMWIEAVPLPRNDAVSVAKALTAIFYRFGAAKNIYSNTSWDFCNEVGRHLRERWNILQTLSPAETSDHTGLDDKTNEMLKSSFRRAVGDNPRDWDEHLEPIVFQFRTSINSVTQYTPFFLMFNRDIQLTPEIDAMPESSRPGSGSRKNGHLLCYTARGREQRNAVKEIVLANISAAGKERRKSVPRPLGPPPARFKVQDEMFGSESDQPLKKFKHNHIMSFKFETVLSPEEMIPAVEKTS